MKVNTKNEEKMIFPIKEELKQCLKPRKSPAIALIINSICVTRASLKTLAMLTKQNEESKQDGKALVSNIK